MELKTYISDDIMAPKRDIRMEGRSQRGTGTGIMVETD